MTSWAVLTSRARWSLLSGMASAMPGRMTSGLIESAMMDYAMMGARGVVCGGGVAIAMAKSCLK